MAQYIGSLKNQTDCVNNSNKHRTKLRTVYLIYIIHAVLHFCNVKVY